MSAPIACTSADEIAALVAEPCSEGNSRRVEIGVHLASGCRSCWTAIRGLRLPAHRPPSADPVAEAMVRLAQPERWATLTSRHFFALHHASDPQRFVDLVLIEASALARGPLRDEPAVKAFATPILLCARLARLRFSGREAGITLAKLHAERALVAAERGDEINAERQLKEGAWIENDLETLEAAPVIHQTERFLARLRRNPEALIEAAILQLNSVPEDEFPCHQAEIYAELILDLGFIPTIVEACLKPPRYLLDWLHTSLDPAVRRHGLYRAVYAYAVLGEAGQVPEIARHPGFHLAAQDLAAARELFEEHGNDELRLVRLVCLAKLFSCLNPQRARAYIHRAFAFAQEVGNEECLEALMTLEAACVAEETEPITVH